MPTDSSTWKNFEKAMAERLGIKRTSRALRGEKVEDVRGVLKLKPTIDFYFTDFEGKHGVQLPEAISAMLTQ